MRRILIFFSLIFLCALTAKANNFFQIKHISSYHTGIFNQSAAEITAYDPATKQLYLVNAISANLIVLDINNPSNPTLKSQIPLNNWGAVANSVSVYNGLVAVAVEANPKTNNGNVVFFDANGNYLNHIQVGALPDMLTFSPNGRYVVVCNEGEPDDNYTIDPKGTISIIDLVNGVNNPIITNVDFTAFDGQENLLRSQGIRIFGPNATTSTDLEPEYATIDAVSKYAYVTLQENNAIAKIDITNGNIVYLKPFGFKNHNLVGNELDASDKDNKINIANWPVYGMYQPDGIASYSKNNKTYLVTANEGDARDYKGYSEEKRVNSLNLDPVAFPNASELKLDANLGRLTVTSALGDSNNDGLFESLYVFGGRSFSIFDDNGNLVWDSGNEFEKKLADIYPSYFNTEHTSNSFDTRSDNKGPEPEDVVLAEIDGITYAFIVLERIGGFFVYDITNPSSPKYVTYFNHRNFNAPFPKNPTKAQLEAIGDLGPESIKFIPAHKSPNGQNLIVVANEVSGSVSIFQVITKPVINLTHKNLCKNTPTHMGLFSDYGQNITVINGSGDYTYLWTPISLFDNFNSNNPIYRNPAQPRIITLYIKDNQTGLTTTANITTSINQLPVVNMPSLINHPKNQVLNLNSKINSVYGNSPFVYLWIDENGNKIDNPEAVYPQPGINKYKLIVFDKNQCASNPRNLFVRVPLNKETSEDNINISENGNIIVTLQSNTINDYLNFSIQSKNSKTTLEIYNSIGTLIKRIPLENQDNSIDFTNYADGFYLLSFINEEESLTLAIVKE